jgi:Protein of unknown function (DUF3153)
VITAILKGNKSNSVFTAAIAPIWQKIRVLGVVLVAALALSGCVQYDLGVNVDGEHRGTIVQRIQLGEQLTSFSKSTVEQWLESVKKRSRELDGKIQRVSPQETIVTIPFASGKELEEKFNRFFNPVDRANAEVAQAELADLPKISSHLKVNQGNFIFLIRNQLTYDVDLRSLGVASKEGAVLISPGSLINLDFSVRSPWGGKNVAGKSDAIAPEAINQGKQTIWHLQPGQINHLEFVFWLPSPIGIGALIISLLVALGIFLKGKGFLVKSNA